jgi:hypothetical protein
MADFLVSALGLRQRAHQAGGEARRCAPSVVFFSTDFLFTLYNFAAEVPGKTGKLSFCVFSLLLCLDPTTV